MGGTQLAAATAGPGGLRLALRALATFALWATLAFGLCMLAVATVPSLVGYRSLTIVSGSMEPTLGTGSVVIDRVISPLDAGPGDIVTFQDPLRPRQLTHRLRRMHVERGTAYMVTRGDANDAPEHWTVQTDGRIGRVVAHLPKLGYVRVALGTRHARLAVLVAVIAFGVFLVVDMWRPRRRGA